MKAMILAAGKGTRLRPVTLDTPKVMLPIDGRPLVYYIVSLLRAHGITEIAINLHHHPEVVQDYLGDGGKFGIKITYSFEECLLGTAGAFSKFRTFFTETFVSVNGDMLTDLDITSLVRFHRQKGATATIALFRVEDPTTRGVVEIDSEKRIHRFVEKPAPEQVFSNLVNAGVYALEPEILKYIPDNTFSDMGHDTFPALLSNGAKIYGYQTTDYLLDIGTLESYHRAQRDVRVGKMNLATTLTPEIGGKHK